MSDTTARGDGVIVDRGTAATGTLPRPGRTRPARPAAVSAQARRSRTASPQARQAQEARQAQAEPRRTQAAPKRPRPAAAGAPKARPKRPQAEPRPQRIRTTAPGTARAAAQAPPKPAAAPAAGRLSGISPAASNRMPFIVLLCGLLGGALASALVINTTLASGSFEISKLRQSDSSLARQRQQLQDQVSLAQSAPVLQQRAYELGMRPASQLQFLNLKTGKVENGSGSAAAVAGAAASGASAANESGPGATVRNP